MLARLRVHRRDVDLLARQELRQVAQQSLPIARLDDDVDREQLIARRTPVRLDQPLRFARADPADVRARGAMNRDAFAPRDEADDRIRRRRLAAARETRQQAIDADDEDAAGPSQSRGCAA